MKQSFSLIPVALITLGLLSSGFSSSHGLPAQPEAQQQAPPAQQQQQMQLKASDDDVETNLPESVRYGLMLNPSGVDPAGAQTNPAAEGIAGVSGGQLLKYEAPDDCHTEVNPTNQEVRLVCNLRTVNSEFETTNFSVIPSEHTVSLTIVCDNDIMAKSTFRANSFVHLVRLRELIIVNCKVDAFGQEVLFGLTQLQNLTVQSKNFNLNLVIEPNAFALNKRLQHLDLSLNNLWQLTDHLFCPLTDLLSLNVSGNRLQDLNELSFSTSGANEDGGVTTSSAASVATTNNQSQHPPCNMDLEVLDLSSNQIVLLPALGVGKLKRLRDLNLANNEISMLANRAFGNLKLLKRVNLNSNKIVALPSELFQDSASSVQEIYLRNNSITALSPNLFSNLDQLLTLDLSQNQISSMWLNKGTFAGLIRLMSLNLSQNKIQTLNEEMFADLYTLQILNLRFNQIEILPANTFSPMTNLYTLLLSNNKIKYLDGYSLNGLFVLSLLSLDNNQLTGIHPEAFRNCSSLQDLNLNGNQMKAVPLALKDMRFLHTVDLGENAILSIDEYAFRGMENLYGLRLIGNQLRNLTKSAFKDLPKLQILNLAKNQIDTVEPGTFEMVKNIQAIRLDGNRLRGVSSLFRHMNNLLWLNMSDNQLNEFDYAQIPTNLQWLDLHKNELTELKNDYQVTNLRLQSMDVSFNRLERIGPGSIPNSVEIVFLNDNLIRHIDGHTFINKENLTRCDLYANHLQTLDIKALRILPIDVKRNLPEFYIGGNPFVCDCNIEWLQKINQQKSRQYPVIMDLDKIYCKLLYNRDHSYIPLINAETENFLCEYKTHCFALCHCCEFDACDCEMTCPNNCTCFHDQSWSTNIVDCSATGTTQLPATIPMDTTELYLDGNNFSELSGHTFIGRKNLKILYANSSNINVIYNTTFIGLKRLRILHLEDNNIRSCYGSEFNSLDNLMELYLHNNEISYIEPSAFAKLKKLQILRLDNNQLVNFEIWQFQANPYLVQLTLASNLWTCECSFLTEFLAYLNMNLEKINDNPEISCQLATGNGQNGGRNTTKIYLKEKNLTKCVLKDHFNNNFSTIIRNENYENFIPLLLVATCTFVGFFGLIIGMFCYRNELKLWTHTNCFFMNLCYKTNDMVSGHHHHHHHHHGRGGGGGGGGLGHLDGGGGGGPLGVNNLNKKYFYDAYVTYSLQDEHFINQILINQLEQDFGYQLLLHYRDFNLNTYVIDTIVEAIEMSKTTVLLLTKNFLYNEWSRFEFKSALHEIIKRRKKLIFIVYGDLPKPDLDADLQLMMRSNVCIEWDDKKFWNKLRLALPPVRKINNSHNTVGGGVHLANHRIAANAKHLRSSVNIYATANDYNTTMRRLNDPIPPIPPSAMQQQLQHGQQQLHAGVHNYATIANYGRTTNTTTGNCDNYEAINNSLGGGGNHNKFNTNNDRRHHQHHHQLQLPQPLPPPHYNQSSHEQFHQQRMPLQPPYGAAEHNSQGVGGGKRFKGKVNHEYEVPCLLDDSLPSGPNCDSSMISTSSGSTSSTTQIAGQQHKLPPPAYDNSGNPLIQMGGIVGPYSNKFPAQQNNVVVSNSSNNNSNESLASLGAEDNSSNLVGGPHHHRHQRLNSYGEPRDDTEEEDDDDEDDEDEEEDNNCSSVSDNILNNFQGHQQQQLRASGMQQQQQQHRRPPGIVPAPRASQKRGYLTNSNNNSIINNNNNNNNSNGNSEMMLANVNLNSCSAGGGGSGPDHLATASDGGVGVDKQSDNNVNNSYNNLMLSKGSSNVNNSNTFGPGVAADSHQHHLQQQQQQQQQQQDKCHDRRLPQQLWA